MHMDPFLPNEGAPGKGPRLVVGSVLAIEPMLTLGTYDTEVLEDKWTVVTTDAAAPRIGSTPSRSRRTDRASSRSVPSSPVHPAGAPSHPSVAERMYRPLD